MASTLIAMVVNLGGFLDQDPVPWPLFVVGGLLLILGAWLVVEALLAIARARREPPRRSLLVLDDDEDAP